MAHARIILTPIRNTTTSSTTDILDSKYADDIIGICDKVSQVVRSDHASVDLGDNNKRVILPGDVLRQCIIIIERVED